MGRLELAASASNLILHFTEYVILSDQRERRIPAFDREF